MADLRSVCCVVLLKSILYFLCSGQVHTLDPADERCSKPWSFSVDKDLKVSWVGDDRDGVVEANFTTSDIFERNCSHFESLRANFKERKIIPHNPCSNSRYTVNVALICKGVSTPLQSATVLSAPNVPDPPKMNIIDKTNTSISVLWKLPDIYRGSDPTYSLRWKEKGGNGSYSSTDIEENSRGDNFTIEELKSYTFYQIQIRASNEAGFGRWSNVQETRTLTGMPTAPTYLHAVQVQATNLTIKWLAPKVSNGLVVGYVVHWGIKETDGSLVKTSTNTYTALGLRPYTEYFFNIAAETESGQGPSVTIYKKTDISVPSAPKDVLCTSITDHCILLEWSPPEHPNAPTLQYIIKLKVTSYNSSDLVFETDKSPYRVRDLAPGTDYSIQVCAKTDAGTGPWTNLTYFRTKEKDRSSAIIAGSVVGSIIFFTIVASVVLLYLAKQKGGLKNLIATKVIPSKSSESIKTIEVPLNLDDMQGSDKIDVRNFDEHVLKLMSNGYFKLAQEFEKLGKDSSSFPTNEAKKSDNLTKNRWVKILPFDHSRVKLRPVGDEVEPDFINASYIPGETYLLEYIATQGPLPNTINDFWRMVWQESVFLMVMLTQCVERAKKTCEKYWPSAGASQKYGEIEVLSVSESITPLYIQRLFLVSQGGKQRHIIHLHYTNWPVSGCPKSPDDFLTFVKTVRGQMSSNVTGPTLVHCSAGIGRTGTFIAVDRIAQQIMRQCEEVDIYGTILDMRKYRANLVQTEEQYYFIYLCIQRLIQEKRQEIENDYGGGIYSNE